LYTFEEFTLKNLNVQLVLPHENQAEDLYNAIEHDRTELSKWMPWVHLTNSVDDEIKFINYARMRIAEYKLLELTILVNNHAKGMVDIHNIDSINRTAEFGYWLSSDVQGNGIITESVKKMASFAFNTLETHKLILQADASNFKSIAIAKALGFQHEATLKQQIVCNKSFRDLSIFVKFPN